jgi:hypothetical protein
MQAERGWACRDRGAAWPCRYLGTLDEAQAYAAYATSRHRCYGRPDPTRIATGHQEAYCLSGNHGACAFFSEIPSAAIGSVPQQVDPASDPPLPSADGERLWQPPEDQALAEKLRELHELEIAVAGRVADLAALRSDLAEFDVRWRETVGARRGSLVQLRERVAGHLSRLQPNPGEPEDSDDNDDQGLLPATAVAEATPELKRVYRELAKHVHPDLAINAVDRTRRTSLMTEANLAFETRDAPALRAVLDEAMTDTGAVGGTDTGSQLIRAIRSIARLNINLAKIDKTIAALTAEPTYIFMVDTGNAARAKQKSRMVRYGESLDAQIWMQTILLDRLEVLHRNLSDDERGRIASGTSYYTGEAQLYRVLEVLVDADQYGKKSILVGRGECSLRADLQSRGRRSDVYRCHGSQQRGRREPAVGRDHHATWRCQRNACCVYGPVVGS